MMLKIGNRAFTLVEVMVAVLVLSLGTVLIYGSFFMTLSAYSYYSNYLTVASFMDEKMWEAQDSLRRLGDISAVENSGTFVSNNRNFQWVLSHEAIDQQSSLFKIDLGLDWQEGKRKISLSRTAYAIYEEKK